MQKQALKIRLCNFHFVAHPAITLFLSDWANFKGSQPYEPAEQPRIFISALPYDLHVPHTPR
jgi:hypothetical protein